ncbi:methyl-accepting chemotaxis protein [Mesorhizobium sp. 1B3]|uniref:methyl-accepting chemotaxis protein n=1 Tax=Mesorhizobium sp. 1B3 TaxID=3243599 RepID=UPI003D980E98
MSSNGQSGFFRRRSIAASLALTVAPLAASGQAASLFLANRAPTGFADLVQPAMATLGVTVLVYLYARLRIARPLHAVARRAVALADGELDGQVPCGSRGDEIGAIARTLDRLRNQTLEKDAADAAIMAERIAQEERRRETESARAAVAKLQSAMLRLMSLVLSRIAEGDLTTRIRVDFPEEFRQLKDDFNLAMDRLQDAVGYVGTTSRHVRSEAAAIHKAAGELGQRSERQAAGIEQASAAARQAILSISEMASGVGQARSAIEAVTAETERGDKVVGQAIAAMGGIEKSSQEINKIIGVIDEIAFQTNLLALNAGVEAARAGPAGRGFAVVASEVRSLAQRSAEAAKEIKVLITASSGQVKNGARLVTETGDAISRISGKIGEIGGMVTAIARSADSQAAGLRGIGTAMKVIGSVARDNADMAEHFVSASRNVGRETRLLAAMADDFRTEPTDDRLLQDNSRQPPLPMLQGATALAIADATPKPSEHVWQPL